VFFLINSFWLIPPLKQASLVKTTDDNLKTKPKDFWKYFYKFKKNNHVVTQLKIGVNGITQPKYFVGAFADHFSPVVIPKNARSTSSEFLNVPSILDSEVKQVIQLLSPSKCVGPD
jgi:hypothetical protein